MVHDRALKILTAIGVAPGPKAAGGRYLRSVEVRPGTRYWATALERRGVDRFGVQFRGRGAQAAPRLESLFTRKGFVKLSADAAQVTFCKEIPWTANGGIDLAALRGVRQEVDQVLAGEDAQAAAQSIAHEAEPAQAGSFLEFMRNSPLYGVALELPARGGGPRDDPF